MNKKSRSMQFAASLFLIAVINVVGYAQKGKQKIVVLNFDDTEVSRAYAPVGKRISNYTIDKLVKSEIYDVVEREVIDKIIKEQNFGASGRVDKTTAAEIGKIAGADLIVYGTVSKYKYDNKSGINIFKRKGKGVVELTARIADAKTAVIIDTIQVKGEVDKEKVDMASAANPQAGTDEFVATIMNEATYDAANKLAAALEKRAGGAPPLPSPPGGAKPEKPVEAKSAEAKSPPPASKPPVGDVKGGQVQQGGQQLQAGAATPPPPGPVKQDKIGMVSQVTGNILLIAIEQSGRVKVGDKLLVKRVSNPIPDPYNPGRFLGYDLTDIGFVTISAVINDKVVKGTFTAVGRRGPRALLPKFQDWVVAAP